MAVLFHTILRALHFTLIRLPAPAILIARPWRNPSLAPRRHSSLAPWRNSSLTRQPHATLHQPLATVFRAFLIASAAGTTRRFSTPSSQYLLLPLACGLLPLMAKTRDLTRLLNMEATMSPEKIQSHRDLIVWQKSMDLSVLIYQLSARFPSNEAYRLLNQITRSAASVPANIAEGRGRATKPDFAQFVSVAKGSLMETETFLMLALRLGYLSPDHAQPALDLITEISKMLTTLRKSLRSTNDGDL
jgi:four helix bundle protein